MDGQTESDAYEPTMQYAQVGSMNTQPAGRGVHIAGVSKKEGCPEGILLFF